MATLRFEKDEATLDDGEALQEAAESLGVPFGCQDGICGTCRCTVVSGAENLQPLTEKEMEYGLEDGERLVCQCVATSGTIELTID